MSKLLDVSEPDEQEPHSTSRPPKHNLVGKRIGEWHVTAKYERRSNSETCWWCICSCGTEKFVMATHLLNGGSRSCRPCANKKVAACRTSSAPISSQASLRTPAAKLAEAADMVPMGPEPEKNPKPKREKPRKVAKPEPEPEPVTPRNQDQEGFVFEDDDQTEPEDDPPAIPSFAVCRKQLPSRYQLVTTKSRSRIFYGVADSKLDSQWMVSENRAVAIVEVKRLNATDKAKQKLPYYQRAA